MKQQSTTIATGHGPSTTITITTGHGPSTTRALQAKNQQDDQRIWKQVLEDNNVLWKPEILRMPMACHSGKPTIPWDPVMEGFSWHSRPFRPKPWKSPDGRPQAMMISNLVFDLVLDKSWPSYPDSSGPADGPQKSPTPAQSRIHPKARSD